MLALPKSTQQNEAMICIQLPNSYHIKYIKEEDCYFPPVYITEDMTCIALDGFFPVLHEAVENRYGMVWQYHTTGCTCHR